MVSLNGLGAYSLICGATTSKIPDTDHAVRTYTTFFLGTELAISITARFPLGGLLRRSEYAQFALAGVIAMIVLESR